MAVTYGSSALPNDIITVVEQSSTAVSFAFNTRVGIVGGYDEDNGDLDASNENTNITISDAGEANALFGEDSQLYRQIRLAFVNGASEIVATPLGTTETTENVSGTATISLSDIPVDPRTNPSATITATDTSSGTTLTVEYVDGEPTSPSASDTLAINPQSGEGEFASSGDYSVTYHAGSYTEAVTEAAKADVRAIGLCSSNTDAATTALAEVKARASEFDFKRLVVGAPTDVDPSTYTPFAEDQRLVVTAPAYGMALGTPTWTSGAVAAQIAAQPLASGITGNTLAGFDTLAQDFSISETTDFGTTENLGQVTVIRDGIDGIEIVEGLTTSTGAKFRDIYRCEIIDDIAYSLHLANRQFIESDTPNTPDGREFGLESPARRILRDAAAESPPLLSTTDGETPYAVTTSAGANDEEVQMFVAIDVTGLTKRVELNLTVGAIQRFEGAE